MYTVKNYINNNSQLIRTLVLKVDESAYISKIHHDIEIRKYEILNNRRIPEHYQLEHDKRTHKYYKDLAGIPSFVDEPIEIRSIETSQLFRLTAENLEKYPLTKRDLLEQGFTYNNLIKQYPLQMRYIHGCLFPVPFEKSIPAENGTILNYNKDFIEYNEDYIIKELEDYCKGYFQRWFIPTYTIVETLYLPISLAILYSNLLVKLINLRTSRIATNEVNSFYLEHFFRSNLNIWDEVSILNKETQMWLYKNLRYLMLNIGKEKTLSLVANKIFHRNQIGLGKYDITRHDPEVSRDLLDFTQPTTAEKDVILLTSALNNSYGDSGTLSNIDNVINREYQTMDVLKSDLPENFVKYAVNNIVETVNDKYIHSQKTKLLEISEIKLTKRNTLDIFKLVLDYWVYLLKHGTLYRESHEFNGNVIITENNAFNTDIEYSENQTEYYTINGKTAFLMFLKLLLAGTGLEKQPIQYIEYSSVLNLDRDNYDKIIDTKLYNDGYSSLLLRELKDILPVPPLTFTNKGQLTNFFNDIIEYATTTWTIDSNVDNFIVSANIKRMLDEMTIVGRYELSDTPKTIDELLLEHGINYKVHETTDITKSIKKLINVIFGLELDTEEMLLNNMEKLRTLLRKLTSYSVQVVDSSDVTSSLEVYYNNNTVLSMKNGLVMFDGVELDVLEKFKGRLGCKVIEYDQNIYYANLQQDYHLLIDEHDKLGILETKQDYNWVIDLENTYQYPYNRRPRSQVYGNDITFKALEDVPARMYSHYVGETIPKFIPKLPSNVLVKETVVEGMGVITDDRFTDKLSILEYRRKPTEYIRKYVKQLLRLFGVDFIPLNPVQGKLKKTNDTVTENITISYPGSPIIVKEEETSGYVLPNTPDVMVVDQVITSPSKDLTKRVKNSEITFKALEQANVELDIEGKENDVKLTPYASKIGRLIKEEETTGYLLPNGPEAMFMDAILTSPSTDFSKRLGSADLDFEALEKSDSTLSLKGENTYAEVKPSSVEPLKFEYGNIGGISGEIFVTEDQPGVFEIRSRSEYLIFDPNVNRNFVKIHSITFEPLEKHSEKYLTIVGKNTEINLQPNMVPKGRLVEQGSIETTMVPSLDNVALVEMTRLPYRILERTNKQPIGNFNIKFMALEDMTGEVKTYQFVNRDVIQPNNLEEIPTIELTDDTVYGESIVSTTDMNISTVLHLNSNLIKTAPKKETVDAEIEEPVFEYKIYLLDDIMDFTANMYYELGIKVPDISKLEYLEITEDDTVERYKIVGHSQIAIEASDYFNSDTYHMPNMASIVRGDTYIALYYGPTTPIILLQLLPSNDTPGVTLKISHQYAPRYSIEHILTHTIEYPTTDDPYADIRAIPGLENIIIEE